MKLTTVGILTAGLFAFTLTANAQEKKPTTLEDKFTLMDVDADGKVTVEEFKTLKLKGLNPKAAERKAISLEKKFALLDKNSDGALSKEEFINKVKRQVKK